MFIFNASYTFDCWLTRLIKTFPFSKRRFLMNFKVVVSLTAIAAAFTGTQAVAQIKEDGQWRSALSLGMSTASGNSSSTSIALLGDGVRATKQDKWSIYGSALYGRASGNTTANVMRLGTRYDWNLSEKLFAFGGLDLEKDGVAKLTLRTGLSGGLGYHVIKDANTTFDVFGGLGYTADSYGAARFIDKSNRTSYSYMNLVLGEESTHKLSETVSAKQRFVYYPNLKNRGEYLARFDAGLSAAISKTSNVTVGLAVRQNSDPGTGVKKTDSFFTVGLGMKFE
jgi:putative salt-induced outer membrane protein